MFKYLKTRKDKKQAERLDVRKVAKMKAVDRYKELTTGISELYSIMNMLCPYIGSAFHSVLGSYDTKPDKGHHNPVIRRLLRGEIEKLTKEQHDLESQHECLIWKEPV